MVVNPQVEIEITGDHGVTVALGGGPSRPWFGVRVRYRAAGARRWSKFIVEAPAGQSLRLAVLVAIAVVGMNDEQRGQLRRGEQLQLDDLAAAVA